MGDPPANAWSDSTRENKEKRRPERERTETRSIRKETAAGHAEAVRITRPLTSARGR